MGWAACIIISMQQQIQVERNDLPRNHTLHPPAHSPQEADGFQIINDAEEIIEQVITENYEQDFDSLSDGSREQKEGDNEIKEDFQQVCEELGDVEEGEGRGMSTHAKQRKEGGQREQAQWKRIEEECLRMKEEIGRLQQEIQKQEQSGDQDESWQELLKALSSNKEILSSQQAQQAEFFQSKVGKDSFCLPLLQSATDFQEKLLDQIDKLKVIITMSNMDVMRLKRECRKYEDMLPLQEENKEQFYIKYKKIKRELQDKKEKHDTQEQKEQQLQAKLTRMKEKCTDIEASLSQLPDVNRKQQQELSLRHQELLNRRDAQIKKNTLAMHQLQNACQIVARNVLDLRKNNHQLQQKISLLQQKNTMVEEDSNKLMQRYEAQKEKIKLKAKEKAVQKNQSFRMSPHQPKPTPQLSLSRKKHSSQTKNAFATNIFDNTVPDLQIDSPSQQRYIPRPLKTDKIVQPTNGSEAIVKSALGQSSTSNTLKQFKLKLPSHTPQKSNKNLNISLDIAKSTPNKPKGKADQSKLSITQRLERIELLQREDRIYSHKLNEIKKEEQEKHQNLTVRQERPSFITPKQITSALDLPTQQKELFRDFKALFASKTESSMALENKIMRAPTPLQPQPLPPLPSQQATPPQAQGLTEQSMYSSRLSDRLTNKLLKKRIVYRQKKISEDYMRVLQQKGRKILELDNQSQA